MHVWDLFHGTDFSYIDKSVGKEGRSPYYATPWASLVALNRYIRKNLSDGKGHAVLDIGSGKGYMLYRFSRRNFDRVAGIEYDGRLKDIASRNLEKLCGNNKPEIFCGDAAQFGGYGGYDVFYLYNPFDHGILDKVLARITETAKDRNEPMILFYCNPLYADLVEEYGWKETAHFYYKTRVYRYVH